MQFRQLNGYQNGHRNGWRGRGVGGAESPPAFCQRKLLLPPTTMNIEMLNKYWKLIQNSFHNRVMLCKITIEFKHFSHDSMMSFSMIHCGLSIKLPLFLGGASWIATSTNKSGRSHQKFPALYYKTDSSSSCCHFLFLQYSILQIDQIFARRLASLIE